MPSIRICGMLLWQDCRTSGNFTALNTYIRKDGPSVSDPSFWLRERREKRDKPRVRGEIIKWKAVEKIIGTKSWFSEKINKIIEL